LWEDRRIIESAVANEKLNRVPALQAVLAERGIDVLVASSVANLRYLLGYVAMPVDRLTALLVTPDSAVMILPDFDAAEFVAATGFEDAVGWADKKGPSPAVADAFGRLGALSAQPRALVDDELPFHSYWHLRERLGAAPGRASSALGALRLVKAPEEQELIARAGELVSAGVDLAQERAEPGMTELELHRQICDAMSDAGAHVGDYILVQAGPNSASAHHSADGTRFASGEPVLVDIAVSLDGYFADITQQVVLGEPSSEYAEAYEVVRQAQEAGVVAAVAGNTAADVAVAASAVINEAGYGEWIGPQTGHGLGLDVHEPPSVVEGDETGLVPGVVITIEPGVYLPGRFGIRIEDTVLVTEGAPRRLTRGTRPLCAK
jgi:Xaa-Pro aminopeptidase